MERFLLWTSATDGDLEKVKEYVLAPNMDVNSSDEDYQRSPFYRACGHGRIPVVEFLLQHPGVDVNGQNSEGATPLNIASQQGHLQVVSLLLADPRIDPTTMDNRGRSPLFMAAQNGHAEVVSLLLQDGRSPVNTIRTDSTSPLWFAVLNRRLPVVQLLLSTDVLLETRKTPVWAGKPMAQFARAESVRSRKMAETTEDWERSKAVSSQIATLLESYDVDAVATRTSMRCLPTIRGMWCHSCCLVQTHSLSLSLSLSFSLSLIAQTVKLEDSLPSWCSTLMDLLFRKLTVRLRKTNSSRWPPNCPWTCKCSSATGPSAPRRRLSR